MDIQTAQRDVQSTYLRGSVGQAVSGCIWLASAMLAEFASERAAISMLVLIGVLIFPLTQLALRLLGRPAALARGHPMNALAMQVAFIVPLSLPVIGAASLHNINWFYPAFMVILGVHYMPFVFLYGMLEFGVLSVILIGAGVAIGMLYPNTFATSGWFTGSVLLLYAALVQFKPTVSRYRQA